MSLIPKDATSVGEKMVYVIAWGIPAVIYLIFLLSAFQVFHNFYSIAAASAGIGWRIGGSICTVILAYELYAVAKDDVEKPSNFLLFLIAAVNILLYIGFGFPYWLG